MFKATMQHLFCQILLLVKPTKLFYKVKIKNNFLNAFDQFLALRHVELATDAECVSYFELLMETTWLSKIAFLLKNGED
jgi:hypothetical protein